MENASKALTMAGGILIAVMILIALVSMVQNSAQYNKDEEERRKVEQMAEFNQEYESYQKKLMRGTDVISVVNKANNNNVIRVYDTYGHVVDEDAKITTIIEIKYGDVKDGDNQPVMPNGKYVIGNYNKDRYKAFNDKTEEYDRMITSDDKTALTTFKRKFFKCNNIGYSKVTGLVNELSFEEVDVGGIPDY